MWNICNNWFSFSIWRNFYNSLCRYLKNCLLNCERYWLYMSKIWIWWRDCCSFCSNWWVIIWYCLRGWCSFRSVWLRWKRWYWCWWLRFNVWFCCWWNIRINVIIDCVKLLFGLLFSRIVEGKSFILFMFWCKILSNSGIWWLRLIIMCGYDCY